MIYDVISWKNDLKYYKEQILKYNKINEIEKNKDNTYNQIQKAIFYSAFIIRKLKDNKTEVSDDISDFTFDAYKYEQSNKLDAYHNHLSDCNINKLNRIKNNIRENRVYNYIIHSFIFELKENEHNIIESFYVNSDNTKHIVFEISINEWLNYMDMVINDKIFCSINISDPYCNPINISYRDIEDLFINHKNSKLYIKGKKVIGDILKKIIDKNIKE